MSEATSAAAIAKAETRTFLTLGDGDFTYSLDLARYLATSYPNPKKDRLELIATGIDSSEQLVAKYKDTPFVLQQLQSVKADNNMVLQVSAQHGINAIVSDTTAVTKADHVMFHHPHLGTEDAVLHWRFLCHLFDSSVQYWMKPSGGVLHLTLVQGQYERWGCAEAAEGQGLLLLQRVTFVPPPVETPTYQCRRHQTGKSFEARRPTGSETFSFGRKIDEGKYIATSLPWQAAKFPKLKASNNAKQQELACPFCDKVFREERSRKCHTRDKHPDGAEKKQKTDTNHHCPHCQIESGEPRSFVSEQAFQDHLRAKHLGIHKNKILPDWHQPQQNGGASDSKPIHSGEKVDNEAGESDGIANFKECLICGLEYLEANCERKHYEEFVPDEVSEMFECSFCKKYFREKRAKLQHENFCSDRVTTN